MEQPANTNPAPGSAEDLQSVIQQLQQLARNQNTPVPEELAQKPMTPEESVAPAPPSVKTAWSVYGFKDGRLLGAFGFYSTPEKALTRSQELSRRYVNLPEAPDYFTYQPDALPTDTELDKDLYPKGY